jgi:hypothetical protein
MSPLYKILLVAAHAVTVALIAFPQVFPFALAKPIGRSLPPRTMAVHHVKERSVRALRSKNSKAKAVGPHNSHPSPANVSYHPQAYSYPGSHLPAGPRVRSGDINVDTTLHDINILNTYYTEAYKNAQTFSTHPISFFESSTEKIRFVQSRIEHQLQSRRAHTSFNRNALLRSRTSILTLKASRKRSVRWILTRVTHPMMIMTLVKNCSRNSSTLSKKYSVTSTNCFGANQN